MSSPSNAVTPAGFSVAPPSTFTLTNTTVAKIIVEQQISAAANGNSPAYYGGCSVIDLSAASTDSAAKDIIVYRGRVLTGTGATLSTGSTSTITRATGSFITDGWKTGDAVMAFTPDNSQQSGAGVDGILCVITTVAALTLTVNGTPLANIGGLTSGTRLVKVGQHFRATVAANAGNTAAIANVSLLNNPMDISQIRNEIKLGPNDVLIAALAANASALPAGVTITPTLALY